MCGLFRKFSKDFLVYWVMRLCIVFLGKCCLVVMCFV